MGKGWEDQAVYAASIFTAMYAWLASRVVSLQVVSGLILWGCC